MAKPPKQNKSGKSKKSAKKAAPFPTLEEVLEFIRSSDGKTGKREIGRAFHIKGQDRILLKAMLKELADQGLIAGSRKSMRKSGELASVTVLAITDRDDDGEFIATPERWDEDKEGTPPKILIVQKAGTDRRPSAVGVGDRVLAKLEKLDGDPDYAYDARPIRVIGKRTERLLGIFNKHGGNATIEPIDKKQLKSWAVTDKNTGDAKHGDLVEFTLTRQGRHGLAQAQVEAALGNPSDQRQVSLVAIHANDIPHTFPQAVLDAANDLPALSNDHREDWRNLPLITIDPPDARDHDDAVHAKPDEATDNVGGIVVTVAIADVSQYVRPGSALDKEAEKRGNSCYFPDRVVPMLPEKISNDLCSLRENEDRPCLAARMRFDKQGNKIDHSFHRAMMCSHAKLSYAEAQAAINGAPDKKSRPLLETILHPLWDAYEIMTKGRKRREPLDLELPERKILMNDKGEVLSVVTAERFDAHKLIEEMMIQANVAAAETLEHKKTELIYRTHDTPSKEKLKALKDFLETIDIPITLTGSVSPSKFNAVLAKTEGTANDDLVSEVVLRSQSRAEYTATNYGHFGLNLKRYAHFTSPIRRYADLVVHRALISAMKFGNDGLRDGDRERIDDIAEHISMTERRAMTAERETIDRLIASHLAGQIKTRFPGRISGVTKSGLFIRLDETGADGFIPISTLGSEYFIFDEDRRALIGERSREMYQLGMNVEVRLVEAVPTAGALRFEMLSDGKKGAGASSHLSRGKRAHKKTGSKSGKATNSRNRRPPRRKR